MFCFVFEWPPVHNAWSLQQAALKVRPLFYCEYHMFVLYPSPCLSTFLFFLFYYAFTYKRPRTPVCVCSLSLNRQYPCVHNRYAQLYPWQTSIASTSAETSTPPSSDHWRNHNGLLLDNVIHWCSIHKSNIGKGHSHSVCSYGRWIMIKRKQGMMYVQAWGLTRFITRIKI